MAKLGNPQETIQILQKHDFHFQKKFGQNFLIDTRVLDKIVEAAGVTEQDFVLEIGPGIGTMTQVLCERARQVLAVEIDNNLIPILKETLAEYKNVEILHGDILKQDIRQIAERYNGGKPIKIVANLPYYITTPIIMGLFESHVPLSNVTVMVQKEVAERMRAEPGTKECGGSAVIRLDCLKRTSVEVKDERLMFRLIRASFNQRRKTLQNSLSNSCELDFSKEEIGKAIERAGFPPAIRGEKLGLKEFAALADELCRESEDGA